MVLQKLKPRLALSFAAFLLFAPLGCKKKVEEPAPVQPETTVPKVEEPAPVQPETTVPQAAPQPETPPAGATTAATAPTAPAPTTQ